MRVVHNKRPLPKSWRRLPGAKAAILEKDLRVSPHSRLRAKLMVFRTRLDMRRFYKRGLKVFLQGNAVASVHPLSATVIDFVKGEERPEYLRVDPHYFAVVCLVKGSVCQEVVTHEAVHAAFAYYGRVNGTHWPDSDQDQERLCYPAGRIAKAINRALWDSGIFK